MIPPEVQRTRSDFEEAWTICPFSRFLVPALLHCPTRRPFTRLVGWCFPGISGCSPDLRILNLRISGVPSLSPEIANLFSGPRELGLLKASSLLLESSTCDEWVFRSFHRDLSRPTSSKSPVFSGPPEACRSNLRITGAGDPHTLSGLVKSCVCHF